VTDQSDFGGYPQYPVHVSYPDPEFLNPDPDQNNSVRSRLIVFARRQHHSRLFMAVQGNRLAGLVKLLIAIFLCL